MSILDRVSYHAVYDDSIAAALHYASTCGFAGIQVADETPHLSFEELDKEQVRQIRELAGAHDLYIALHAPDEATSLFQFSRHLQQGIMLYFEALFAFAAKVRARLVTIHLGAMTTFPTDTRPELRRPKVDLPLYRRTLQSNLDQVLSLARGRFALCVENYAVETAILELLTPYLQAGDLGLCWDLAKSSDQPEIEQFFLDHLQWVKQVHLHDLKELPGGERRSHRVIGSGELEFGRYLELLQDADVEDYCIEVRPREKARESLEALKEILADATAAKEPQG